VTESVTVTEGPACIEQAVGFAARFCDARGLDANAVRVLTLILEELMTNSMKHGALPPRSPIRIGLTVRDGRVVLLYDDRGRPFDPLRDLPADDRDRPVEERRVGGLGWPLIRHYCEDVRYAREGDENRLELTTILACAQ